MSQRRTHISKTNGDWKLKIGLRVHDIKKIRFISIKFDEKFHATELLTSLKHTQMFLCKFRFYPSPMSVTGLIPLNDYKSNYN